MNFKIEKRGGINVVVYDAYPLQSHPASPDEFALWARISELELSAQQSTHERDCAVERVAEMEQMLADANRTIAHFLGPDGEQHIDRFAEAIKSLMDGSSNVEG